MEVIRPQIQEAKRTLGRLKAQKHTPSKRIIFTLLKTKDKRRKSLKYQ